jgi:hypothetical protein
MRSDSITDSVPFATLAAANRGAAKKGEELPEFPADPTAAQSSAPS